MGRSRDGSCKFLLLPLSFHTRGKSSVLISFSSLFLDLGEGPGEEFS